MRSIADDKGSFITRGNTNGQYDQMQKHVKQESRERFNRKPWYMMCKQSEDMLSKKRNRAAENLKKLKENKEKEDEKQI